VLFLDELPEFRRTCVEGLRTVLDTGRIEIARAQKRLRYPATFLLIAAMNPCPCGFLGDKRRHCRCLPSHRRNYLNKISGPLLDRIDLQVVLGRPEPALLLERREVEPEGSAAVKERVIAARQRQIARGELNSLLQGKALEEACRLGDAQRRLLARAGAKFQMSGRSIQRALRIARTIADLAALELVEDAHLHEALAFRLPALHELVAA
jgi:magnesium chelatase family protein